MVRIVVSPGVSKHNTMQFPFAFDVHLDSGRSRSKAGDCSDQIAEWAGGSPPVSPETGTAGPSRLQADRAPLDCFAERVPH
jgi:hypothetical protein